MYIYIYTYYTSVLLCIYMHKTRVPLIAKWIKL